VSFYVCIICMLQRGAAHLCTPLGSCESAKDAELALSWHGTVTHFHIYTCVCVECHAQASEFLLRMITAVVLQQCLCLSRVVTLLTQQVLAFRWGTI
jgi:hypothetical protein